MLDRGGQACGLALSTVASGSGSSAIRYLYAVSSGSPTSLFRYTVSSTGIGSAVNMSSTALNALPSNAAFTCEAELSNDGSRFLWGSATANDGKVYEVATVSPYTLTTYTLPIGGSLTGPNQAINGLEYDVNGNIWVSASSVTTVNNGIYKITKSPTLSYTQLSSTTAYNKTHIERSTYGTLFCVNSSGGFGYINTSTNTLSTTTYTMPTAFSNGNISSINGVYSLPDQIDNETYSWNFFGKPISTPSFQINNTSPTTVCSSPQQVYNCNAIPFTNYSYGAPTSYILSVNSVDANCNVLTGTGFLNYSSGSITTLPTDLRAMPGTNGTWLATNTGRFKVTLTASNGCTSHSTFAYLQVNGPPTAVTSCFTFINNTTCSGSGVSGGADCASAINVCANNPKIKGDCSAGQFVNGSYDIVIDEYNSSCGFIKNVGTVLNKPLATTADLVCLSLNDFTTSPGYFFSNASGLRYSVSLTIRNVCSTNTTTSWFIDNIGGCKTDEESLINSIDDLANDIKVSLYPNPTSGNTALSFDLEKDSKVSLSITDLQGKQLFNVLDNVNFIKGNHTLEIPSQSLSSGVYIYELETTNKTYKGKLVKTN